MHSSIKSRHVDLLKVLILIKKVMFTIYLKRLNILFLNENVFINQVLRSFTLLNI